MSVSPRVRPAPWFLAPILVLTFLTPVPAQIIEFWSNGLRYQALTRRGLTLMFSHMRLSVRNYAVVQVALNNGSGEVWQVRAVDFVYYAEDGRVIRAVSENQAVRDLFRNAGYSEVTKLQAAYEKALYGNQHIRSNNGYEQRRLGALAMGPKGVKAAAAASAIAFVSGELGPGDSTDGAVFFPTRNGELGPGRMTAEFQGERFEFRISSGRAREEPTTNP